MYVLVFYKLLERNFVMYTSCGVFNKNKMNGKFVVLETDDKTKLTIKLQSIEFY